MAYQLVTSIDSFYSWGFDMERFSIRLWLTVIVLLSNGWPSTGLAADLFKYVDDDGITVLDDHVPPEFVKNGYTILGKGGRVLNVVPRALSEEELAERARQMALEEQEHKEIADREAADAALLRLYSSPKAVRRARDTKVASVEGRVNTARSTLQRLLKQKRQLEASVANIERAGGTIPKENLDRIAGVDSRIERTRAEIEAKVAEIDQLRQDYDTDLKRVLELYDLPASSS